MSKEKTLKKKWNYIDIILVLVVLLIFVIVGMKAQSIIQKSLIKNSEKVSFKVELQQQEEWVANLFKVGDTVQYNTKEKDTGKIISIVKNPSKKMVKDTLNGIFRQSTIPGKYDLDIVVETKGYETAEKVYAGSLPVTIGLKTVIKNKYAAAEGFILTVENSKN